MQKQILIDGHTFILSDNEITEALSELGWELKRTSSGANNLSVKENFITLDPEVTQACDFACEHCWAPFSGKQMSLSTFDQLLDLCDNLGIKTLQFTGGEPTLNPNLIEMAKRAHERGFSNIIRTHGYHLDRKPKGATHSLAEDIVHHFDEIICSIDGDAEANFDMRPSKRIRSQMTLSAPSKGFSEAKSLAANEQFVRTMQNLELLSSLVQKEETNNRRKPKLIINSVVAKSNKDCFYKFGKILEEKTNKGLLTLDRWDLTQVYRAPQDTEEKAEEEYMIDNQTFEAAVLAASLSSPSIAKRAKPNINSYRCLVVESDGNVCVTGQNVGNIADPPSLIETKLRAYIDNNKLLDKKQNSYIFCSPNQKTRADTLEYFERIKLNQHEKAK